MGLQVIASGAAAPAAPQTRALLTGTTYGALQTAAGRRLRKAVVDPAVASVVAVTLVAPAAAAPAAPQGRALLTGTTYGVTQTDAGRRLRKTGSYKAAAAGEDVFAYPAILLAHP